MAIESARLAKAISPQPSALSPQPSAIGGWPEGAPITGHAGPRALSY